MFRRTDICNRIGERQCFLIKIYQSKSQRRTRKTQAEEPKQEEVKETAPVVETVTCKICKKELDKQRVIKNKYVCYECGYYFRVRTKNRIRMVADAGTFETWDNDLKTGNPLNFPEYEEKVAATQEKPD